MKSHLKKGFVAPRLETMRKLIPKDVETVLDIGGLHNFFKEYNVTTIDYKEPADIIMNLNKSQDLYFLPDKSYDLVIMSQVLEHLNDVEELIKEVKRISKKYIIIGLPNELNYGYRFRLLFGKPHICGYKPYGHKHFYTIPTIESFILKFFGLYEKRSYYFACMGERFVPKFLKRTLPNILPNFFSKGTYYLIDVRREKYLDWEDKTYGILVK